MPRFTKAELIKLQKTLYIDKAIGKKFGITPQYVQLMRKEYGIPPFLRSCPFSPLN